MNFWGLKSIALFLNPVLDIDDDVSIIDDDVTCEVNESATETKDLYPLTMQSFKPFVCAFKG